MKDSFQITRHWRLNPKRYRLEGIRYETGEVSLQNRPVPRNRMGKESEPTITQNATLTQLTPVREMA